MDSKTHLTEMAVGALVIASASYYLGQRTGPQIPTQHVYQMVAGGIILSAAAYYAGKRMKK